MARFVIQGGRTLSGTHKPPGNKNAALPMLAASVLTDETVILSNIPLYEDVYTMLRILEALGVSVNLRGHTVTLCAKGLRRRKLDARLCREVRSSILFAGPMAVRHGRVIIHPPGGDGIGRRPLDTHFEALSMLGIKVEGRWPYVISARQLKPADIVLSEASVTATGNAVMAAALIPGLTTVFNAACEPHVQDLCHMLNKMGAKISGIGTNYLAVEGVCQLHGVRHRVMPDYIEAASFMTAAILTGGALTVDDAPIDSFDLIGRPLRQLGMTWTTEHSKLRLRANQKLRVRHDLDSTVPKIEDGPWPSFPSDLMSVAIVLASQSRGTVLFFEKMFESRMYFVDQLIEMGARIVLCDPHRVIVSGPTPLRGIHMTSPDIRAGMALLLAALCAEGESTIDAVEYIDRGYEQVDRRLRKLGAGITRIKS